MRCADAALFKINGGIMRLKNILIVVNDIEKSKAFYKDLFGLEVVTDFGGNVMLTEGLVLQERSGWEAMLGKKVILGGHASELYFIENDMDAFLEKLEKSNYFIEYVNTCGENAWGKRVVRIYDPDKHVIEVAEKN